MPVVSIISTVIWAGGWTIGSTLQYSTGGRVRVEELVLSIELGRRRRKASKSNNITNTRREEKNSIYMLEGLDLFL